MSGADGFLSRWSRRKLAVEREPEALAVDDSAEAVAAPDEPGSDEALSPEELAALPLPEELTPGSDITAFMRKGVPDMLRKAALRRMWSLDPAVRDYVGDARDYAWDWNVPGGMPGNGPLGPLDDLGASVSRMFSATRDPEAESSVADVPDHNVVAEGGQAEVKAEPDLPEPEPVPAGLLPHATESDSIGASAAFAEPSLGGSPAPSHGESAEPGPRATPLRRHGAALPKFDLF